MTKLSLDRRLLSLSTIIIIVILALIPLHAFLSVWLASIFGHYTAIRLWKEYLLAVLTIIALYFFFTDPDSRNLLHLP